MHVVVSCDNIKQSLKLISCNTRHDLAVLALIHEHSFIQLNRQYLPNRSDIHIADKMVSMDVLVYVGEWAV